MIIIRHDQRQYCTNDISADIAESAIARIAVYLDASTKDLPDNFESELKLHIVQLMARVAESQDHLERTGQAQEINDFFPISR